MGNLAESHGGHPILFKRPPQHARLPTHLGDLFIRDRNTIDVFQVRVLRLALLIGVLGRAAAFFLFQHGSCISISDASTCVRLSLCNTSEILSCPLDNGTTFLACLSGRPLGEVT